MGRAFEFRRARKEKRWDKMAKAFTKLGREIAMAVKQGGAIPETNPRLRLAIQNAKGVNMPKDRVEAAIKRASSKEAGDFQEVVYEGYAPNGVALVIECATDNPTRTVANIRSYLNHAGGSLGTSGSLDFMFDRKGVFRLPAEGVDVDALQMELIDYGAEDILLEEDEIFIYTSFQNFGTMQNVLEEKGIEAASSEAQRIPSTTTEISDEAADVVVALIEKIEDDDDVQAVYHNMA
jgi:YebC/PmpR family DNA-binding regulatory protein